MGPETVVVSLPRPSMPCVPSFGGPPIGCADNQQRRRAYPVSDSGSSPQDKRRRGCRAYLMVRRYAAQPRGHFGRSVSPAIRSMSKVLPNQCSTSPGRSANSPNGRRAVAKRSHAVSSHSKHHSKNFAPGFANDLT